MTDIPSCRSRSQPRNQTPRLSPEEYRRLREVAQRQARSGAALRHLALALGVAPSTMFRWAAADRFRASDLGRPEEE